MTVRTYLAGTFAAAAVVCGMTAGCASDTPAVRAAATQPDVVTVVVDDKGVLASSGFIIAPSDLEAFAKEVKGRKVVIKGFSLTPFKRAVTAKRDLEAAGVTTVVIGDITSE